MAPSQPKLNRVPNSCGRVFPKASEGDRDIGKFADIEVSNLENVLKQLKSVMVNAESSTSFEMLDSLKIAATTLERKTRDKCWTTDSVQTELPRRFDGNARPPSSSTGANGLCMFDYSAETKAMLSSAGEVSEEWIQVELTEDGACDTVMPRSMCSKIPIEPSLQSLRRMGYEAAEGNTIPNLGERRCVMWTRDSAQARHINLQVADVHKPLLSLSRCADIGFEVRFGRTMGALIDEETGEVVPLKRKGNLYVPRCCLRAPPFDGQESRRRLCTRTTSTVP